MFRTANETVEDENNANFQYSVPDWVAFIMSAYIQ